VPPKIVLKVGFLERDFERDHLAEKSNRTKMGQKIHCAPPEKNLAPMYAPNPKILLGTLYTIIIMPCMVSMISYVQLCQTEVRHEVQKTYKCYRRNSHSQDLGHPLQHVEHSEQHQQKQVPWIDSELV
jgi:hypothetical protein